MRPAMSRRTMVLRNAAEFRVQHHWWNLLLPLYHAVHNFIPLIIGGGGAAGGQTLWQKLRQRRAAAWPSADGEVQFVDIKAKNGYTVIAEYRYYARSEYRNGKYSRHYRRKTHAQEFADAIRGRHIQVRYQEDNPDVSVVLDHDLHTTGALQIT
jgi:hypothetical protein